MIEPDEGFCDTPTVTTFRPPCGCLLEMTGTTVSREEPCLVHEHEAVRPMEAMAVFLRVALMDEDEATALATIRAAHNAESEAAPE